MISSCSAWIVATMSRIPSQRPALSGQTARSVDVRTEPLGHLAEQTLLILTDPRHVALLEPLGQRLGGVHLSHPPVARCHPCDPINWVGVTQPPGRRRNAKEDQMSVMLVRQKVKDGSVQAAEAAARDLFATLDRMRPEGLRYASTRVVDSSTFVILTELADGIDDPRPAIPEFLRFLEQLKGWVDGPPVIEQLDVVGSYNLFGTQREESAVR
jgi:hypothetical protein